MTRTMIILLSALILLPLTLSCETAEHCSKSAGLATLVSDSAFDLDGDGMLDAIIAVVNVDIQESGYCHINAYLIPSDDFSDDGDWPDSGFAHGFEVVRICGPQNDVPIPLVFAGKDIRDGGISGDYSMTVRLDLEVDRSKFVALDSAVYRLSGYSHTNFKEYDDQERINNLGKNGATGSASIRGVSCDGGIDVNGDGYYDFIYISLDVDVHRVGYFFVSASIHAEDGTLVCDEAHYMSTQPSIGQATICAPGANRFHLVGSGRRIMMAGVDGPLFLKAGLCVQGTGEFVDLATLELSSYESSKFREWETFMPVELR